MSIEYEFDDIMIKPRLSMIKSRNEVSLIRKFKNWEGVPIIAANMDSVATVSMAKALSEHKIMTALNKHYTEEDYETIFKIESEDKINKNIHTSQHCFYSMGIHDYEKFTYFKKKYNIDKICIDVANGYMVDFIHFCEKIRNENKNAIIMAGNIIDAEAANILYSVGVDIVKVGLGSGLACTTRRKTGVGRSQFSAICDVGLIRDRKNKALCSDGGCKTPGDVAKAFTKADFVMLGGMLSAHEELNLPEEFIIKENGKIYYLFYGMSSEKANLKNYNKMEKYKTSEGAVLKIESKGSVHNTIQDILGGIRSMCSYTNNKNIKDAINSVEYYYLK